MLCRRPAASESREQHGLPRWRGKEVSWQRRRSAVPRHSPGAAGVPTGKIAVFTRLFRRLPAEKREDNQEWRTRMKTTKLTRRDFLRLSAMGAGGLALAACAAPPRRPPPLRRLRRCSYRCAAHRGARSDGCPAAAQVVLEVIADTPEYAEPAPADCGSLHREESQCEGQLGHLQRGRPGGLRRQGRRRLCAGTWRHVAASGNNVALNKDTYGIAVDLSTIDYPYWDQFLWDIKNTWSEMYGLSGPRCIDPFLGYVMTWQYHQDLLDKAGLDPAKTVKNWEDLKMWLDEGSKWAKSADSPVDRFWDQGWLEPVVRLASAVRHHAAGLPRGPARQPDRLLEGREEVQRRGFALPPLPGVLRRGVQKGWLPESFWTRTWEADMESSFAAKKSAVMCHGPWTFDKTMSIDPTAADGRLPRHPARRGPGRMDAAPVRPGHRHRLDGVHDPHRQREESPSGRPSRTSTSGAAAPTPSGCAPRRWASCPA